MKIFRVSDDDRVCYDNIIAEDKGKAIELIKDLQVKHLKKTEERMKTEEGVYNKNLKTIEEFIGKPTIGKDGKEVPVEASSIEKQKKESLDANQKRYDSIKKECKELTKLFSTKAEELHYFVEAESI